MPGAQHRADVVCTQGMPAALAGHSSAGIN